MSDIYQRPAELLQHLIRFDTTNPPGNEIECIAYIDGLLKDAGCETMLVGKAPDRPNLISRLKGRGEAPPLLLYGHVDVVPTAGQDWQHPPFGGDLVEGYIWGRGALDMKGPDAMLISAFLRAKAEGLQLPGDLILAMVSDEEAGSEYGARYLVEHHAELFDGVRYALGEFGGFAMPIAGKRFYPIMVAEKRICTTRATVRGPGGHGALRHTGGTMAKVARLLTALDQHRLPVHHLPVVVQMIEGIVGQLDEPLRSHVARLLDPAQTDATLDEMGEAGRTFDTILHNSVNVTFIRGGVKDNVIPSEVVMTLDGRVLPGLTTAQFYDEIRALVGDFVELEPIHDEPVVTQAPDVTHFETLAGILREADPTGTPIPYLANGATDGRYFAQLGIQTYGFTPMNLPPDFNFAATIHAANERITVEALEFGTRAMYEAVVRLSHAS